MNQINEFFNKLIKLSEKNKYTKYLLIDIIIDWNIPYFQFIKRYLIYISLIWFTIFIYPKSFKDFWEYSYNLLIFILLISPLFKIFPKIKILSKIILLRREIWIIIWNFLIAHIIWFFIKNNINVFDFLNKKIFNLWSFYFWWIWWTIFMFFPFITSNNISQKILKSKWKYIQKLTYLFFIFSVLHVYTLKWDISELLIIILWIFLKILVHKKVVILK